MSDETPDDPQTGGEKKSSTPDLVSTATKLSGAVSPAQAAILKLGGKVQDKLGIDDKARNDIAKAAIASGGLATFAAVMKNKSTRRIVFRIVGAFTCLCLLVAFMLAGGGLSTGSSNGVVQTAAEDQNSSDQAMLAGLTDDERTMMENAGNQYNVPWELIAAIYLEQKAYTPADCQPAASDSGSNSDADVSKMSSAQLAGQHVMVGMSPSSVSATDKAVKDDSLNGVFLAGNWPSKSAIQSAASGVPAVNSIAATVAADREGGQIQLNGTTGPSGMANIPSAVDQAKMGADKLKSNWQKWSSEDKGVGITTTFGPVADYVPSGTKSGSDGAYNRQYGTDPKSVAPLVTAVIQGDKAAGEESVAKHFPGLGLISGNTDMTGDKSQITDNTTTENDLDAFKAATGAGSQIMVSSAYYTKIDPSNQAVFSKKIISDILRSKMSFSGVVYSDEIGSAKAVSSTPVGDRATKFIDAGGDVALVSTPSDAHTMVTALAKKADSDKNFKKELQDSTTRILAQKQGSSTNDGGATGDCSSSTSTNSVDGGSDSSGGGSGDAKSDPNLPDELKKIRFCESSGDYTAQNPTTSASGGFQIEDATWKSLPGTSKYTHAKDAPASVQDSAAEALYKQQGGGPWTASKGCWGAGKAPASYPLKNLGGTSGGGDSKSGDDSSKSGSSSTSSPSSSGSDSGNSGGSGNDAPGNSSQSQTSNNGRSSWTFEESKGTTDSIEAAKKSGDRWRLLMEVAKYAKNAGWQLGENPVFGGVTNGVHVAGSLHYYGQAIDLNHDNGTQPMNNNPQEVAAANKLMPILRSSTIGWIWQAPGHLNHVHIDTGAWYIYHPENPSNDEGKPDCAKGMVPAVTGSLKTYSPSNQVHYAKAPPCDHEPGDVGTSSADQNNGGSDATDGSKNASKPDYISPFLIPKDSVDPSQRAEVANGKSASIDWIASHLSSNAEAKAPRDMHTGLIASKPSDDQQNATYDIDDNTPAAKNNAAAVKKTWTDATTKLKLENVDSSMSEKLYDLALNWVEGKPGTVPTSNTGGGDGTAGGDAGMGMGAGLNGKVPQQYVKAIEASAKRCPQLSAPLIAGEIMAESSWNTHAVSPTGAQGIAQFEPGTWAEMEASGNSHWDQDGKKLSGNGSPWNPYDEIGAMSVLLCQNYDQLKAAHVGGNMEQNIFAAYNAGVGAIEKVNGDISKLTPETQNYFKKILQFAAEYSDGKGGVASGTNSAGGGTITGDARSPLAMKAAQLALGKVGASYTNARPLPHGLPDINVGADCSGLVMWAYWEASGEKLYIPGNTSTQVNDTSQMADVPMNGPHDLSNAKVGDVILFNGISGDPPWGHAAIYIGGGKIMEERNPSMKAGVSDLSTSYWQALQWKVRQVKATS